MTPEILTDGNRQRIEQGCLALVNDRPDFLSEHTARSTRAAGDAIQSIVEEGLERILAGQVENYAADLPRRAMADLTFDDLAGHHFLVDVKTHCEGTTFNMPNLTSVDRLAEFYGNDSNYFVVLMVRYAVEGHRVLARTTQFVPIEAIKWECLTLGALGTGQIQIANSNRFVIDLAQTRHEWMIQFCDAVLRFYPREIEKIRQRIAKFEKVR